MPVNQWIYHLDVSGILHNEDMSFEERRATIVERVKESRWYRLTILDDSAADLFYLVEELEESMDEEWFNWVWDGIYDVADADRCWINTF